MPLAKIHVVEGRYDDARIGKISGAIQAAFMNTLHVPADDFYQLIFEIPRKRFLHTSAFVGMHYTDDLMITLYEVPGENISFGQGEAQRANAVPHV